MSNPDAIPNNAAISTDIDIVTNHYLSCPLINFNADSRILPNPNIFPNNTMGINHDAGKVWKPDPFSNLCTQHDLYAILSD